MTPEDTVIGHLDLRGSAEGVLISAMRAGMARFAGQLNNAFETDAELLDIGGAELIALTVDTLTTGAELAQAPTPYEKGWLTTTVSMSDLAAVGARPVAVLLSCCLPNGHWTERDAREFGSGASDAARAHGGYIVGGDTNWAGEESFTSCALGLVPRDGVIGRRGAAPGHALYTTGPIGGGNATGFRNTVLGSAGAPRWLPSARCAAAAPLRAFAQACIDTSDGLLSAAMMMADVNQVGVEIHDDAAIYESSARDLADSAGLPRWLLAVGEWGEYELLYSVRAGDDERDCRNALAERGIPAVRVGSVTAGRNVVLCGADGGRRDGYELIRRLRAVPAGDGLLSALHDLVGEGS